MIGYIYKYTSPNNKSYIGQTINTIKKRANNGNGYKNCSVFWNAIQKYKWENFSFEILINLESENKDELLNALNLLEEEYINLYNTLTPYGYNIRKGGNNFYYCDERKQKLKGKNCINWRTDIDDNLLINMYQKENKTIKEISEILDIPKQTISRHLSELKIKKENYRGTIDQFDLHGNFIQTWNSAREICNTLNINYSVLGECYRKTGRKKSAGGYKWAKTGEQPIL